MPPRSRSRPYDNGRGDNDKGDGNKRGDRRNDEARGQTMDIMMTIL